MSQIQKSASSAISALAPRPRSVRRSPFGRIITRADGTRKRVRLYLIWESMCQRCHYPKQKSYYRYGARGIRVCDEWLNDYAPFRAWAISHGYAKDLTLDRADTNGNYEPDNCQWIPAREQQWNMRTNHYLTLNGVTKTLPVWAHELGLDGDVLRSRKNNGWTDEQILLTPHGKGRINYTPRKRGRRPKSQSSPEEGSNRE